MYQDNNNNNCWVAIMSPFFDKRVLRKLTIGTVYKNVENEFLQFYITWYGACSNFFIYFFMLNQLETRGGFQLAQLVKPLVVEQGTWVQIPPTPKMNWCLGLMVRATIMSGRHRFKCYRN